MVLDGDMVLDGHLGVRLGRSLGNAVATRPGDFLGDPAPLVSPGRPLPVDEGPERLLAKGFGLPADLFDGDAVTVLDRLRDTAVLRPDGRRGAVTPQVRNALARTLHREVDRLVADTLAGGPRRPDALERLLAGLEADAAEAAKTAEAGEAGGATETSVTPRSGREEGETGEG
jgi:predicted RNA-binding Zn ribbon-like protein